MRTLLHLSDQAGGAVLTAALALRRNFGAVLGQEVGLAVTDESQEDDGSPCILELLRR
ncbi:MAG: hypothetical protein P1U87_03145 [Verrucomicrobiales bacterium]|nr:hypothetical protein [Verrucomicrobiales bacterium]